MKQTNGDACCKSSCFAGYQ